MIPKMCRLLASLLCAIMLTAFPLSGKAADPYVIYVIQASTGSSHAIGNSQTIGLRALEAYVNGTGGIEGRSIKFIVDDDQSNPVVAVQLITNLLTKQPAIILGPSDAASCRAVFQIVKSGPVIYCTSPVVSPESSFQFIANSSMTDMIVVGIRYLRLRGWTRLAEISTTDASGQIIGRAVDAAVALPENKGVTVVERELYGPSDLSVNAQIARIKAANAQAMLINASGSPIGAVLHGIADIGLDIPIATNTGATTDAMMKEYGKLWPPDAFFFGKLCLVPDSITDKGVEAAYKTFASAVAQVGVAKPDDIMNTAWDDGSIAISALRRFGLNASAVQLRDYIANLRNFDGSMGRYDFKTYPGRGLGQQSTVIVRRVNDAWIAVSKPGGYIH